MHPALVGSPDDVGSQQCCARDARGAPNCSDAQRIPVIDNIALGRQYCESGLQTGTWADMSRCVVVGLKLPNNSLAGALPNVGVPVADAAITVPDQMGVNTTRRRLAEIAYWERTLHDLHVLHLEDNHLRGELPVWLNHLPHLRSLNLHANLFDYETRFGQTDVDPLLSRCRSDDVACSGLPPGSCTAFAQLMVPALNHRHACTPCETQPAPSQLWSINSGIILAAIVVVCVAIVRANEHARRRQARPRHLRRWVAGGSIMLVHLQTMALVGDLRFAWPDHLRAASAFLSADPTWAVAAECLQPGVGSGSDRRTFVLAQIIVAGAVCVILLLLFGIRELVNWRIETQWARDAHAKRTQPRPTTLLADRLDLARSIVQSCTFGCLCAWPLNSLLGCLFRCKTPAALQSRPLARSQTTRWSSSTTRRSRCYFSECT
jgi:hypothetical protein